jgi:hypothetical protein
MLTGKAIGPRQETWIAGLALAAKHRDEKLHNILLG